MFKDRCVALACALLLFCTAGLLGCSEDHEIFVSPTLVVHDTVHVVPPPDVLHLSTGVGVWKGCGFALTEKQREKLRKWIAETCKEG